MGAQIRLMDMRAELSSSASRPTTIPAATTRERAMSWLGADHAQRLQRELAWLRSTLERIAEVAHNPDCFSCAQVRRLAREGGKPALAPLDDWQT
jgi:hypothetical protein